MTFNKYLKKKVNNRSFLIAEAGVNHENSFDKAKKMIIDASKSGADSIKFQTYKASTLASKKAMSYWNTNKEKETSQHKLFSKYDKFGYKEYRDLKEICDNHKIEFSTSVFDYNEIDKYSELLGYFKVASADITNYPLHKKIISHKKPVIVSTGAASMSEIFELVDFYKKNKTHLTLLHCVLNYPCNEKNANLLKIEYLKKTFPELIIGYSDHIPPVNNNLHLHIANILGASVIEKHFTYNKNLEGNDHYHSFDKDDIIKYRKDEKFISNLISSNYLDISSQNDAIKNARRSIVVSCDLKPGDYININNISVKRPGYGISPKYIDNILGLRVTKKISNDTPLTWDDFK